MFPNWFSFSGSPDLLEKTFVAVIAVLIVATISMWISSQLNYFRLAQTLLGVVVVGILALGGLLFWKTYWKT